MKRNHRLLFTVVALFVLVGSLPVLGQEPVTNPPAGQPPATSTPAKQPVPDDSAKPEPSPEYQRQEINKMAKQSMDFLLANSPEAKKLYDAAYGYAAFDNFKLAFLLTGGGGKGVAVPKSGEERIYMNMGGAGIGIGLGAHKYQIVFLFENEERFNKFVNSGWVADASANAVIGKSGANAETTFHDGMAYYQITENGLMLQADVAGTKYWRDEALNQKQEETD